MPVSTRVTSFAFCVLLLGACQGGGSDPTSQGAPASAARPLRRELPKLRRAVRPLPGKYLVMLADDALSERGVEAAAAAHQARFASTRVTHTFVHVLRGYAAELTEADAQALSEDPSVAYVAEDSEVFPTGTQTGAPWNLDRIDQRSGTNGSFNYTWIGAGVHAYVIDSGIRTTHVEFGGRATSDWDGTGLGAGDCMGHGTHVAGTIGGATYGVAKGVRLHAVRVFRCEGGADNAVLIAALDWVAANAQRPAVVNMSLGAAGSNPALETAVRNVIARGIPVVIAAGNDNIDACGFSPANVAEAITVGASTPANTRASFSNFGSCVDLFAPGTGILSSVSDGDNYYGDMDGTSMATPHVTGDVAQYLQYNPSASPATVTNAVINSATWGGLDPGPGSAPRLLFTDVTPPAAPRGLYAAARDAWTVEIDWYDNTESDLAGYLVFRNGVQIAQLGRDSHYWARDLWGYTTYDFSVRAYNYYGQWGAVSGTFTVQTPADPSKWQLLPGLAADIGVGGNQTWIVGTNSVPGGHTVFYWTGSNWNYVEGGATRISVDPGGNPWIVNSSGNIFRRQNGSWVVMPGLASDIAVGANGSAWVLGVNPINGGYNVFYWTGSGWNYTDGAGVRIAVDPAGNPWIVNSYGNIFRRENGRWIVLPGEANDIGIGANGAVWIVSRAATAGGYSLFYWNGTGWNYVDGGGTNIAVDGAGRPWMANASGNIFARHGNQLIAKHSGKCADVYEISSASGARIVQWGCWGGANQEFTPIRMGDGSYIFWAGNSGKCLDVAGWGTGDGAAIQQWDCHYGDNQRFWLNPKEGNYEIVSKYSGKCLDVAGLSTADGAGLQQWTCLGNPNQRFYLR